MINLRLAREQNLSVDDILSIERLHAFRDTLHNSLEGLYTTKQRELVYEVGQVLFKVETSLQKLWQFDDNINFYKFWNVPTCVCPKHDNNDAFPYGRYITAGDCWLHADPEVFDDDGRFVANKKELQV